MTTFHEILHIFGLLHPHQGYETTGRQTKRDMCEGACIETAMSGLVGDFVADTPPTPDNRLCQDPRPCQESGSQWCSNCEGGAWRNTHFHNVMGYAPDPCIFNSAANAFRARGNNSA